MVASVTAQLAAQPAAMWRELRLIVQSDASLYYDFLGDNGFQILWLKGVQAGPGMKPQIFDLPPFDRFNQAPAGSAIIGIFQRREIRPIAWPVQRKYRPAPQAA